jgi:hypothetical protein
MWKLTRELVARVQGTAGLGYFLMQVESDPPAGL